MSFHSTPGFAHMPLDPGIDLSNVQKANLQPLVVSQRRCINFSDVVTNLTKTPLFNLIGDVVPRRSLLAQLLKDEG